ncbi:MAG TPA: tRNA pseudouridine(38-40) synthase TruA [Paenalcaligenes sp.]|nr:tRNA pseudouridine(38-40) synthase TruA [Paenalcaligenes sp.]
MQRWSLGIAYNGDGWHGWQKQPNVATIQAQVESALYDFLGLEIQTVCAGRTDTGVHALEQVVHLDTALERREMAWIRGLNSHLPNSIRVQWARQVDAQFHARFSAQRRHYLYLVRNAPHPTPFTEARVAWVFQPLQLQPMQEAAKLLVGTHDFSSFRSADCQAHSPIRELQQLNIWQQGEYFIFYFCANAFLHHMVRNLMGVLIHIGKGKQPARWARDVLEYRDRRRSAPTFSPTGLYLARVDYPAHFKIPQHELSALVHRHLNLTCVKV